MSSCKGAFHPKCLKLTKSCTKSIAHSRNIVWFCNSCTNESTDGDLVLGETFVRLVSEMRCELTRQFSEMKKETFTEIDLRISALHKNSNHSQRSHFRSVNAQSSATNTNTALLDVNSVFTNTPSTSVASSSINTEPFALNHAAPSESSSACFTAHTTTTATHHTSERVDEDDSVPAHSSSSHNIARTALLTGAATDPSFENFVPAPADRKAWLFVTHIAPHISEEEMKSFIATRLQTQDCVVKRILPRDRNPSTLRFVSFKVSFPRSLRNTALSPTTWPRGFDFAEFEFRNRRTEDFFIPGTPYHSPV